MFAPLPIFKIEKYLSGDFLCCLETSNILNHCWQNDIRIHSSKYKLLPSCFTMAVCILALCLLTCVSFKSNSKGIWNPLSFGFLLLLFL